jgi:hypothetical protein
LHKNQASVKTSNLQQSGFTADRLCSEVARALLIGTIPDYAERQQDLNLVSWVANNLWKLDGTTGLSK